MKISVFGTGYVGLVTGACLADAGNHVVCMDVDQAKIEGLLNGVIPIYESGLETLVKDNVTAGRLVFTTDAAKAVDHGEFLFVAVGTPPDEDGSADLKHVLAVAKTIGRYIETPKIVIDKSTVPVGTADKVSAMIQSQLNERSSSIDFSVVSNPEFLKEGAAIKDFMRPDRIVLGSDNSHALDRMKALYAPFNRNHDKIISMDVRSAEMTKYAANAMLATKISFMNEMSNLAERVGADIELVRQGIGSDNRIGFSFIYPGAGYGGSCFPKDVKALVRTAYENGFKTEILDAVESVNQKQKEVLGNKIKQHFGEDLSGRCFALWGLAFKPNTDDMREASSLTLINRLHEAGAKVKAYDPEAMDEARRVLGENDQLQFCGSAQQALEGADALIVMTEWKNFWSPDFEQIKATLKQAVIFDGRNIYDPQQMASIGIDYYGIGRGLGAKR